MASELCADTGRPDSRELSRVVVVRLLSRSGASTEESSEFCSTGIVTRTPVDPGQLVPGDPAGLARAAALAEWAASMRMAWVDLQNDFIDDLAEVREELGIADRWRDHNVEPPRPCPETRQRSWFRQTDPEWCTTRGWWRMVIGE